MTQLFRSKSCVLSQQSTLFDSLPPSPFSNNGEPGEEESRRFINPIASPLVSPSGGGDHGRQGSCRAGSMRDDEPQQQHPHQFSVLDILVEALRKSLVTCTSTSFSREDDFYSLDIGWPSDVRHVSHVTFDRFNGFLGLPAEFQPEIPGRVPSASVSVFGVSPESMQCSYDHRGNSVPTILLMMQRRLYSGGGLQAEGIFRINPENSQEEYVRSLLNRGILPNEIDVHCLAGLIKAWFRELPAGVLDFLTPEQVMNCNTEEECTHIASLLRPTEFALLDWAVNLMADVVQFEHQNKMNARNIAMVFAPNMTQMADPLTALLHAVQVMNFLKTLTVKLLREREKSSDEVSLFSSCSDSPSNKSDPNLSKSNSEIGERSSSEQTIDFYVRDGPSASCSIPSQEKLQCADNGEVVRWTLQDRIDKGQYHHESICGNNPKCHTTMYSENECGGRSGSGGMSTEAFSSDRSSWRHGVRKICKRPVFQLSRSIKKPAEFAIISTTRAGAAAGTEACT
ncbi:hypothetical protein MKW94_017504 [Papaver nudicaule]|uniref:Rho-GAP domain-containing protein n=1 Tax=Papaver nudicaule TaxID=74823 RepID=A0AA41VYV2_PAPNU|nr:hypothetical protein [Papaver nudicaule]MCL7050060.1 hypothetical protein [Papaver nudicaule]